MGASLPATRFQLDQGDFFPGETVKGVLTLLIPQSSKSFKATDLSIRLMGVEQTNFSPNAEDLVDVVTKHGAETVVVDIAKHFKDIGDGHSLFKVGVHSWSFSFDLPNTSVPPSFQGSKGSIKYMLVYVFGAQHMQTSLRRLTVVFATVPSSVAGLNRR
jgi:hypothetical protein